jgi:hypothetical protein
MIEFIKKTRKIPQMVSHSPVGDLDLNNIGQLRDSDGKVFFEQEEQPRADALWALKLFEKNMWDDAAAAMISWGTPNEQSSLGHKFLKKGLRHLAKKLFLVSKNRTGLMMTGEAYLIDGYFDQGMNCYKAAKVEPDIISLRLCLEAVEKSKLHACFDKQLELEGRVIGMIKHLESR